MKPSTKNGLHVIGVIVCAMTVFTVAYAGSISTPQGGGSGGQGVTVTEGYTAGTVTYSGGWTDTSQANSSTNVSTASFTLAQTGGGVVTSEKTTVHAQLTGGTATNWTQCSIPTAGNVTCNFSSASKPISSITGITIVAQGENVPAVNPPDEPQVSSQLQLVGTTGSAVSWGYYGGSGGARIDSTPFADENVLESLAYVDLQDAVQISTGGVHSCALMRDTTARCWGNNASRNIGDGTGVNRLNPVPVLSSLGGEPLSGITQISAGYDYSCAVMVDTTARCWGSNGNGKLGYGSATSTTRSIPTPVLASAGGAALTGITQISAGIYHTCAVMSDTTARCWGSNGNGQLGDGTTTQRTVPTSVLASVGGAALTGFTQITTSDNHTCAVMSDTTARCWGSNGNGRLGDGTTTQRTVPRTVLASVGGAALTGFTQISTGSGHTCAVMSNTTARCWGLNTSNQLGDGTTTQRTVPTSVLASVGGAALTGFTQISTGSGHTCAVMSDTTARCWGSNWGRQLGDGTTTQRSVPVSVLASAGGAALTNFTQLGMVTSQGNHTCAVMTDTTARCWGASEQGKLGSTTIAAFSTPVNVIEAKTSRLRNVVKISGESSFACALMYDTTARCWGNNYYGKLGDGTTTDRTPSVPVLASVGGAPLTGIVDVTAGAYHACALMSDSTARCWGNNSDGQLGDGDIGNDKTIPTPVLASAGGPPLTGITQLSAKSAHTCAVMSDTTARCWGYNEYGQLGDGTWSDKSAPTPVLASAGGAALTGITQIVAAGDSTCAVMSDTTARCWGTNWGGQLGDGAWGDKNIPTPVLASAGGAALTGITQLAGYHHFCAVMSNTTARCWGTNWGGQLGDGGTGVDKNIPTSVLASAGGAALTGFAQISASPQHTCAVMTDTTARCWGYEDSGNLGRGLNGSGTQGIPLTVLTNNEIGNSPYPGITLTNVIGIYATSTINSFAVIGPKVVPQLSDQVVSSTLDAGDGALFSLSISANGTEIFGGTNSSPAQVVRYNQPALTGKSVLTLGGG